MSFTAKNVGSETFNFAKWHFRAVKQWCELLNVNQWGICILHSCLNLFLFPRWIIFVLCKWWLTRGRLSDQNMSVIFSFSSADVNLLLVTLLSTQACTKTVVRGYLSNHRGLDSILRDSGKMWDVHTYGLPNGSRRSWGIYVLNTVWSFQMRHITKPPTPWLSTHSTLSIFTKLWMHEFKLCMSATHVKHKIVAVLGGCGLSDIKTRAFQGPRWPPGNKNLV